MCTQAAEQHEQAAEQYGHAVRHYQEAAVHKIVKELGSDSHDRAYR